MIGKIGLRHLCNLGGSFLVICLILLLADPLAAKQVFTRSTNGEVETLDPHRVSTMAEIPIIKELFEGLVSADVEGNPIPGAAAHWEVSEDGLTYHFELRPNLTWSDGVPMTAADFVWSLRRFADPRTANPLAGQLFVIKNARAVLIGDLPPEDLAVSAPHARTVVIQLEHRAPYFPELLVTRGLPVPRHVVERYGDAWTRPGNLVGNGAFVLSERVPQSHVKASRNPRFREASTVALDEVFFVAIEDLITGVRRFRSGEIDMALNFPQNQLKFLRENYPTALRLPPFLGYEYYAFNVTRPPFDDVRVRRALSMAIDRQVLATRLLRTGDRPADSYVAPGTANYPNRPLLDFVSMAMSVRRETARALLTDAGFGGAKPLQVTLKYPTREDTRAIAVAVAAMWRQIGVETELFNAEARVHSSDLVKGDFEIARGLAGAEYNDPTGFLRRFRSDAGPGSNVARYARPGFDRLLELANNTADIRERAKLLVQAEQMLLDEHPWMPLYFIVSKWLVNPAVEGWVDNLRGVHLLRYVSMPSHPGD